MSDPEVSPLEFPCEFPLKIMGLTQPGFAQAVIEVVKRHAPDFDPATVEMRSSREAKYLSITTTINATSREQLDDLYRELCDHPMVSMVL
jgi:putative lipoic acid-binding regulatory protein